MVEITTAVGRIVWGSPTKSRDKTRKNPATGANEKVIKADGTVAQQWAFGVAFDKATFQNTIWPALAQEAQTAYQGGQVPPKFAWKYVDGDGVDDQGKPFNQREGYAGCYVLAISTELMAPPIFKNNGGSYVQLPADAIKCGDYVSLGLNIKANVPQDRSMTPGLYINPLAIEWVAYGTEIVSTGSADPNAIFKGVQHQLPAGASATPIGGGGGVGMPGMGAGMPMQPVQPQHAGIPGQGMAQPGMMQPPMGGQPQYAPQPGQMQPGQQMVAPQPMQAPGQMPGQPMQPQYAPQPGQMPGQPMQPQYAPQPGQMPAPAPDFVHNAGMPQQPMQQPMGGQPGYGQPMQQPGMMQPGMMPGR